MGFLLVLFIVFFAPLFLFLAWLAFTIIRRSRIPARLSDFSRPGVDAYGRDYLRTMAGHGPAMSEQIELEDMLEEPNHED